jgi:rhomboid protease GluP
MKTWVTWALIAANVAMFGIEIVSGVDPIQPLVKDMIHLGADFGPYTIGKHEWWRVVTSMFLHYGVLHIAMNMICLAQGRVVEKIYGPAGFAAIYFVSGLLGGVGSLARGGFLVSAGASGAVFGVFGAFAAFLLRSRDTADKAEWSKAAQRLGTFIAINLVIGFQSKGIDITAHVVGLITGFLAGLAVPKIKALPTFGIGLALTIAGLLVLPAPFDVDGEIEQFHEVEHKAVTLYNAKLKQAKANEIDRLEFARTIEQEILPPWHAETVHLDALPGDQIPSQFRPLFDRMRAYAHDREQAWQEGVKVQRDEVPDTNYKALEARVRDDITKLGDEMKRLTADK